MKKELVIIGGIVFLATLFFNFSFTGNVVSEGSEICNNIDDDGDGLIDEELYRPCGCECSPPSRILMVLDDNHHNEDLEDFDVVYADLLELGADVDKINEPKEGLEYSDISDYELVWFSNPGWPIDDEKTIDTLSQHVRNGYAVVFQGDDLTWSMKHKFDDKIEEFTGLKNINNGRDGNYDVAFSDNEHPLLNLLGGEILFYDNDDVDTSIPTGDNLAILAMAWRQSQGNKFNGPAVVVRDYTEQGEGVLLTTLLTMVKVKPESKRKTFVSNIVNWLLIRTENCVCPQGPCGPGFESCINGVWSDCTLPQPEAEVCDGLDNDCDNEVDEDLIICCGTDDCKGFSTCEDGVVIECRNNEGLICPDPLLNHSV